MFFGAQLLEEQARKGEELLASVDKSYQRLEKIVHHGTAQVLDDQIEKERKRLELKKDKTQLTDV